MTDPTQHTYGTARCEWCRGEYTRKNAKQLYCYDRACRRERQFYQAQAAHKRRKAKAEARP